MWAEDLNCVVDSMACVGIGFDSASYEEAHEAVDAPGALPTAEHVRHAEPEFEVEHSCVMFGLMRMPRVRWLCVFFALSKKESQSFTKGRRV